MIIKNGKYGNIEGVTIASFGSGTISLNSAKGKDHNSIILKTHEAMPIGATGIKYKDSDHFNPELVIAFDNKESFDVFFETVLEVKQYFEESNG